MVARRDGRIVTGTGPGLLRPVSGAAGTACLNLLRWPCVVRKLTRLTDWPSQTGALNIRGNLPTFDPTTGGDVVERLSRDARFNVALGAVRPFLISVVLKASTTLFDPFSLEHPQTLIWTVSAWALLPASLFMRGIAIGRIAEMIREQRRRAAPGEDSALLPV